MKKMLLIVAVAGVFTSCGNRSESSPGSDSTTNSISPPPMSDSTNAIAPMMGDTSKTEADSLRK